MAYFYVKNSLGTRTSGGGLTKQTGSFTTLGAASVYATIEAAFTDGATSGDFVCVSDAHSFDESTASADITYAGPTSADFVYIVSVDDSNCDAEKKATSVQELTSGTADDIVISGRVSLHSIWLKVNDSFYINIVGSNVLFSNSALEFQGATDSIAVYGDGVHLRLDNCDLKGSVAAGVWVAYGSVFEMFGGSCEWTDDFLSGNFINAGGISRVVGVDLSSLTGYLLAQVGGSASADDTLEVSYQGCKLGGSTKFVEETFESTNQRFHVSSSSSDSSGSEYQYYFEIYGGSVEDETGIYRDGSTAYPSSTKASLKCVTDTNATPAAPFLFDFPTRYAELSSAATDTIRLYILSSATLYDSDVWAEAVYPDGTTKNLYNFLSTRHGDILDVNGTELTTNAEAWTGRTTENRYQIDLDTSGDAGADCVPIIRVYVAKASATIYFCTSVDTV